MDCRVFEGDLFLLILMQLISSVCTPSSPLAGAVAHQQVSILTIECHLFLHSDYTVAKHIGGTIFLYFVLLDTILLDQMSFFDRLLLIEPAH